MQAKSSLLVIDQQLHPPSVLTLAETAGAEREMFPGMLTPGWLGMPLGAAAVHNSGVSIIYVQDRG